MNKTISVHLGGRLFYIEEEAYATLSTYLNTIRSYFSTNKSCEEIIADIELRIAELFIEKLEPAREVVVQNDVTEVITQMGQPESYIDEDEPSQGADVGARMGKRVFRDPDHKVIFGVCGGLGAYIGVDPLFVRLAFVLLTIFYASGILIYLLLALIIPEAKTTADKLRMRGEAINIDNISKKVSESFTEAGQDIKDFSDRNRGAKRAVASFADRLTTLLSDVVRWLGNVLKMLLLVLAKVLGLLFSCAGIAGVVFACVLAFAWQDLAADQLNWHLHTTPAGEVLSVLLDGHVWTGLISITLLLVIGIPALALLVGGLRVLGVFHKSTALLGLVFFFLWIGGLVAGAYIAYTTAHEYGAEATFKKPIALATIPADSLYIGTLELVDSQVTTIHGSGGFEADYYGAPVTFPGVDSTDVKGLGMIAFTIAEKPSTSLEMLAIYHARGADRAEAARNAKGIEGALRVGSDSILFSQYFAITEPAELRQQQLSYVLRLPLGTQVYLDETTKELIDDIPNVQQVYDWDMVGHWWVMSPEGLSCTSCPPVTPDTALHHIRTDSLTQLVIP